MESTTEVISGLIRKVAALNIRKNDLNATLIQLASLKDKRLLENDSLQAKADEMSSSDNLKTTRIESTTRRLRAAQGSGP